MCGRVNQFGVLVSACQFRNHINYIVLLACPQVHTKVIGAKQGTNLYRINILGTNYYSLLIGLSRYPIKLTENSIVHDIIQHM